MKPPREQLFCRNLIQVRIASAFYDLDFAYFTVAIDREEEHTFSMLAAPGGAPPIYVRMIY
ncbi:MAG: hypothetical protein M3R29_00365 [Verrucomicrobiota bacterium]|nr:hypothetical protein [Verrucomicrobiota bacterium]